MSKNYALITGAAGGLGKAFCLECARMKINLIMADLKKEQMERLAEFIQKNFMIHVICLPCDLSSPEGCISLYEQVKSSGVTVNIIVNNAGVGGSCQFEEKSADFIQQQININILAPTLITRLFITDLRMCSAESYVLNVASLAGFFNLAGKQVYGATKAYLLSLSRTLRTEFSDQGIYFSVLCPGGINSNLKQILQHRHCTGFSKLSILQPEEVAQVAMRGLFARQEVIVPGLINKFFLVIGKWIPRSISNRITRREFKKLMDVKTVHPPGKFAPSTSKE